MRERSTEPLGYPYSQEDYIFPIQWGAGWSYLEFPHHRVDKQWDKLSINKLVHISQVQLRLVPW